MKETDGMPLDKRLLHPGLYVYDLVYNVPATALVKEATRMKLHAVTGIGMLLYQGAIAFEIWTGKKAPVGVMRRALREALKGS
jgi:shikimate dehydrogenase